MLGDVLTVSSFSRAASSSVCGPCQTSSYFTWNASDRYWCRPSRKWKCQHAQVSKSRKKNIYKRMRDYVFSYYCVGTARRRTCCQIKWNVLQLQDGDRRMKMQNMVKFPLTGMDMAPHMVKRSQSSWSLPSHWSPWRRPYGMGRDPEDYLYDLYAVCNHHGTMQGGHYTGNGAASTTNGLWLLF